VIGGRGDSSAYHALETGGDLDSLYLPVLPPGSVTGSVKANQGPDKVPLPGVQVGLLGTPYYGQSDSLGVYHLDKVPQGEHVVYVLAEVPLTGEGVPMDSIAVQGTDAEAVVHFVLW
jgi:hypothetical protein